jgi:hypothetical protein
MGTKTIPSATKSRRSRSFSGTSKSTPTLRLIEAQPGAEAPYSHKPRRIPTVALRGGPEEPSETDPPERGRFEGRAPIAGSAGGWRRASGPGRRRQRGQVATSARGVAIGGTRPKEATGAAMTETRGRPYRHYPVFKYFTVGNDFELRSESCLPCRQMSGRDESSPRNSAILALGGGAMMLVGLPFTWISVGIGSGNPSNGLDLFACWVPIVLTAIAVIGFAIAWWRTWRSEFANFLALAAGFSVIFTVLTLVAIENASDLIPLPFIPASTRPSSAIVAGGGGLWVSLGGSAIALLAAGRVRLWDYHPASHGRRGGVGGTLAAALLLTMAIVFGWLRYQSWINSSVLGHGFGLSGQAAPWVGPTSLFALFLLAGAVLLAAGSRYQAAGLLAAGSGWLVTFLAAIALIASGTLARVRIGDLTNGASAGHTATVHVALAAWGTYVSGVVIALIGAFLVCWSHQSGGGEV